MAVVHDMLNAFKRIIPPMTNDLHKGSMGRVGVFGGSPEYTGAPYFSGISALRSGADLAYIFSASAAAPVIKSYSPELMVMPFLDSDDAIGKISPWLGRLHSVVIGPGLGRRDKTFSTLVQIINSLKTTRIEQKSFQPIIFDADGLYFAMRNIDVLKEYPGDIYLTPNQIEFNNFVNYLVKYECREELKEKMGYITKHLGPRVTVLLKGQVDKVYSNGKIIECDVQGSPRRCGGQGDMLSGFLGTFSFWVSEMAKASSSEVCPQVSNRALAAVASSAMTRTCNRLAFAKKHRSTLASDMIDEIDPAYRVLFDS